MARPAALAVPDRGPVAGPVEFTPEETEVLLRICRRHRSSLPSYLRCAEKEARLVDEIIRKISPPR